MLPQFYGARKTSEGGLTLWRARDSPLGIRGVIMSKNLLIRIGIAAAILLLVGALALPAIVAWICLIWMVWKRKANIFHDQMDPKATEGHLKRLKVFLLVAGISLVGGIAGVVGHNAVYALTEIEESVLFWIAIAALWVFILATTGGVEIVLKGRRK
jgi:hypothetical protein